MGTCAIIHPLHLELETADLLVRLKQNLPRQEWLVIHEP